MESTPTCATCGAPLTAEAVFCAQCGKSVHRDPDDGPTTLERLSLVLADRYRIERQVGKGGMATVFVAQDLRHERRVAIKVLHPELAASVGADRFDREIKVSARLQHPHILSLYDSGVADGLMFYVMPFVEGESLRDRLDRENMLPVDDALRIILEIADALGYAHGLGIVHRDIKPENVLLQGGHALVADFGIARAVTSLDDSKLTQTGTTVGTPLYMSPEQAHGNEVGPSGDLYSLACVGYEMLTGQPPFTGANPRAIMARHTMEAVPSLRVVRDTVPEEVEEALLWALAKVPADRPQTAAQFTEALGTPLSALATRRTATRPRLTAARPAVTPQAWRRPAVIAGGALVLVLSGVAAAVALRGTNRGAGYGGLDSTRVAVLYFDDLSPNHELAYLADGLTEGLISALGGARGLNVVSRGGAEQVRGRALGTDSIARLLNAALLVQGSVRPDGENVRVSLELVDGVSGAVIARASIGRPAAEALALRDSLVAQATELVRRQLGSEIRLRDQRAGASNPDAWVLLQRAERLRKQLDSAGAAGDTVALASSWAAADSLLAEAARLDRRWPSPVVARAQAAYARSRAIGADNPVAAEPWIRRGIEWADSALLRDADNPDALEVRGNLRYWRWLLQLERTPARADQLLREAQADLERARTAGAWASLSHLYNQLPTTTGVNVRDAARAALDADAFLGNADKIYERLFFAAYDLGVFPEARSTCAEAGRRFPTNPRFTECRLWMLTSPAESADVGLAWRLVDALDSLTPAAGRNYQRLAGQLRVAAVLARAGQPDSARRVVARAKGDALVDPTRDLANIAAFAYTLLGDTTEAVAQLRLYLAANPSRRQAFATDPGWWFRDIARHPGFRQAVGLP